METVDVPTRDLATMAAPYNPRTIEDHDLEALRRSLRYLKSSARYTTARWSKSRQACCLVQRQCWSDSP